MTTISVPMKPELEQYVEDLVREGYGANKADVIRNAIKRLKEEEAVQAVLRAEQEPTLSGDLQTLMNKL
jgi:putative addiction module CopG family antidote